ncbi:MAG: flagellar filament capping protein FliD [Planctomycetes bacterium]|nr:flagellar filament capping protein FliD [Planctomycetota bacterium]
MSTAGISFGGLASGLDTKSIITALVAVERRPIDALTTKKGSLTKQKTLMTDLRGLLDKLTTAAKSLKTTTDFLKMKAASDDETVLTASASSSATPGSYTVSVEKLARAQINWSSGSASPTASLGANATFMLTVGGEPHLISVGSPTQPVTLESSAAAINDYDDLNEIGMQAEVVNTGAASNPYQLVIRSTTTGTEGAFTLEVDEGSTAFEALFAELNQAANKTSAQNAELKINGGITIQRSSNEISDLFAGITLDLKSAKPGTDVTVTVSTDAEATSKKVQDFVDAYNKVVEFIANQNVLDADGKAKNPLFGDSTLRSLRTSLRGVVGSVVNDSENEAYQMLAQIGVTADRDGKLTFNSSKFAEALAADEQSVATVFTGATGGIATRLVDQIDVYTDTVDGLLKSRDDGFGRLLKDTQNRIDQGERRLTLFQQQLEAKYANLESLLSKLQSQGSSISSIG